MSTASQVVLRIEHKRDKAHAILERASKIERKYLPMKAKIDALRAAGSGAAKVEQKRDRCAALLARQEKLERRAQPLRERLESLGRQHAAMHGEIRALRGGG